AKMHVINDGHLFMVTRAESLAPILMKIVHDERRRSIMHPRPFLPKTR
ncbi:poly(3-hydroxyalkanoate) depolymerase, partial [Pseudomonas aeruginosa]